MSRNESRKERKKQENKSDTEIQTETRSGINKIYYYIIGFLFLVLLLLIIFIFTRNSNNIKLDGESTDKPALVENENQNSITTPEENTKDNSSGKDSNESEESDDEDSIKESTEEEDKQKHELEPGESTVVNEDAPHHSNHATDYNEGSTDRIAIKNEIIAATGLNDDLIEWWVGNDGAGRVEATVSNREQSVIYQVHLQYGDGSWHVLDYERIDEVPNN